MDARERSRPLELTERQHRMLEFIEEFLAENGYPPTIREIGRELGISSTSVVNYNLNKLEKAHFLERDSQVSRGLKLASAGTNTIQVPVLGTIAAGQPIPVPEAATAEEADEFVELTRDLLGRSRDVFALHVKGDSMIDALIHDGDIVVMQSAQTADNGDMVAVWLQDQEETTLKRIYRENGTIRLQPANPTMAPIFVPAESVRIQGKVIAVIRSLN
jgi:repressor LexA